MLTAKFPIKTFLITFTKTSLIFLTLFLFSGIHLNASERNTKVKETYDLHEICRIAMKTSEQIKISEEDIQIAEMDKKRALAENMPSLSFYTDHMDYKDTSLFYPRTTQYGGKVSYSFSLGLRGLTALKIAGRYTETAGHDLSNIKEAYLFQVVSAYYDILRAQKALDISNAEVLRLKKYEEAVKSRYDVGAVIKTAYLRANAELAGATSTRIQTENYLLYTRSVLKKLVPLPDKFQIVNSQPGQPFPENISLSEFQEEAVLNREDLLSLRSAQEAAEMTTKWYRKAYWPEVILEANYFNLHTGLENGAEWLGQSSREENISFYGNVSFTLYDGGTRNAEIAQAKARARQAKEMTKEKEKQIRLEVETAYLELDTQKNTIDALKEKLQFSQENLKALSEQFATGLVNSIDIMDANTLLVKAERELAEAEFQYSISELHLHKAKGSLLEALGIDG